MEWDKFYPKKVLQIGGVKLSTKISHVIFLSRRVIQNLFYPKTYLTYFTLLYEQKAITIRLNGIRSTDIRQLLLNLIQHLSICDGTSHKNTMSCYIKVNSNTI